MRKGQVSKEQAIAIVGVEAVNAVARENCDFTGRIMDMADDGVEFSASVSAANKDGEDCTLTAYYYPTQGELDGAGDDLSNVNWEIAGYEVDE